MLPSLSYTKVALEEKVSVLIGVTVFGPLSPVSVRSIFSKVSVVKELNVPTATVLIVLVPIVFLGVPPLIVTACISFFPLLV